MKTTARLLIAASCLFGQAMYGQVVPGRYILQLAGDPAAVSAAKQGSRFAAREANFAARRAGVRQGQAAARAAVAARGGTVLASMDTVINALIVTIPDARANQLLQIPGALQLHPVHQVKALLSHALPLHKVPDAWAMLPLGQNSAGAGIKIGMIDTGVDVNNPAFSDPLPPVAGFPRVRTAGDVQFTNAKIIVARNYTPLLPDGGDPDANDRDGHGTGTALAAAGGTASTPFGTITGVAPKAYIGSYKALDANGGTSDVIAKAIDDAVADGMDVINLSLGAYVTSYSDIAPTEVGIAAIEAATNAGVVVTVSAGNAGPGAGSLGDYASAPDAIALGAIMNDRALGYAVTADGGAPEEAFPGSGPNPGQVIAGPLFDVTTLDASGLACSPLPSGSVAGQVVLVLRGTCAFADKLNDVAAGGALAAIVYNSATGASFQTIVASVGTATLPAMFMDQAQGGDLLAQLAANPGVSVALDFRGATAFATRPDLTSFTSRGPSIGSAMKPDLVAVGDQIVTGAQNSFPNGESYSPSGFINTAGTSFSAPLAAGAAAVLKAARPGLTVQQYRSLLINGAGPAMAAPNVQATVQQAGAGVLNLAAAVSGTVAAYPTSLNFGTGAGTVNNTLQLTLWNLGSAGDTFTVQAVPPGANPAPQLPTSSVALDANGSQQIAVTLSGSGLAPGEYQGYLQVTGTANSSAATVPYWFAVPGSDPAGITVIHQDNSDPAGSASTRAVVFRVVDVAGLPYTGSAAPRISVTSGTDTGSIRATYRFGDIPGTYATDIRTGASTMELAITVGGVSTTVVIPVI
jgi:minor extracellular serine protease Vpr